MKGVNAGQHPGERSAPAMDGERQGDLNVTAVVV